MEDHTQFSWRRAGGLGHVWQTLRIGKRKRVRLLTPPTPAGVERAAELIQPQKLNPALLWQLAETDSSEPAIKEFADAFGLLAGETMGRSKSGHPAYFGDPHEIWVAAIADARMVKHLWTAADDHDDSKLETAIIWDSQKESVRLDWEDGALKYAVLIASPDHQPQTLELFEPGELVMPARIAVARFVNEQLQKLASPALLWSDEAKGFGVYLQPQNLLGAIWLQFAEQAGGRKVIVNCEFCGTPFERTRKDRRHCSARCRVRALQKRKESKK